MKRKPAGEPVEGRKWLRVSIGLDPVMQARVALEIERIEAKEHCTCTKERAIIQSLQRILPKLVAK